MTDPTDPTSRPSPAEVADLLDELHQLYEQHGGANRVPADLIDEWEARKRSLLARITAPTERSAVLDRT